MIALHDRVATLRAWECAADLALKAREKPTEASLEAFTRQFELALFLAHRLDLTADHGALTVSWITRTNCRKNERGDI